MSIKGDDCPRVLSLAVHEFRTPVTVVAGYLRMLVKLHGAALGEQPLKLVDEAEKSCMRLAALIAEMSDLGQVEDGRVTLQHQVVDFGELLEEVASGVHEGEDREVRLRVARPPEPLRLVGDGPRLRQAVAAVLAATLRERAEPGTMVAAAGLQPDLNGETCWLTVAPEDATTASFVAADWAPFDRFRGGVGFRLLLASAIVEAHGGALYSGPGSRARGTCALTLPVKEMPR